MKPEKFEKGEDLVTTYFELVNELRQGKEGAVDKLVDMWDSDGVFEFAGAPPVSGTFQGRNAIHTLYRNRLRANGMPFRLEGDPAGSVGNVELGIVSTKPRRVRVMDGKVVVGWATEVGTADKHGFSVSGSHTFKFKDGKIVSLKVVVSPKADETPQFDLKALGVEDIGRLSLAAWMVV
ncbi:MAG TPA: nuclear transport factor 2 family protein [Polyangiaceae bacterium]|nr:nuclear transport factor 2 family protein [Polyangiaceae bacterium]